MNTYNRDIIVGLINKYHPEIKSQLELFYSKERDFQFKQDLFRCNWYIDETERRRQYQLEIMHKQINTKKNLTHLAKNPKNKSLEYISLINLISQYLLYKYNKSEKSFYKFITKLDNGEIKLLKQKKFSKNKKIVCRVVENKIIDYNRSIIDISLCNQIIKDIQCVQFTTERANLKRLELINHIKKMIQINTKTSINYKIYVNYLPDTIFNKLGKLFR